MRDGDAPGADAGDVEVVYPGRRHADGLRSGVRIDLVGEQPLSITISVVNQVDEVAVPDIAHVELDRPGRQHDRLGVVARPCEGLRYCWSRARPRLLDSHSPVAVGGDVEVVRSRCRSDDIGRHDTFENIVPRSCSRTEA